MSRWRNIQEAADSVTAARTASGHRSGISRPSPAPSRYTRCVISIAYRNGLTSVMDCKTLGMLLSGVVSPDRSMNGIISTNEKSMACCMVAATDDISNPIPIAASRKRLSPA